MKHLIILSALLLLFSCSTQHSIHTMKADNDCSSQIPGWVQTINDDPDMLHTDYTPSVHRLGECGLEAIRAILPLLNSSQEVERLRAQRVLEGVIQRRYGWKPGQGYIPSSGEQKAQKLFHANGDYRFDASEAERSASIQKWEKWLTDNTR